jgi:enoyl-CoA hydratase/carnithine racemase
MDKQVVCEVQGAVGVISLNRPGKLNCLTLEMVSGIYDQVKSWEDDPQIKVIILKGDGPKAFCAGGDVVSITTGKGELSSLPGLFFEKEYAADLSIHQCRKPVICLAHGIVMGGGIGLMIGAKYRVAFENTMLAMPEVTIGLFPDVGATYFLGRMPKSQGLWMGLTGARINGHDAKHLGMVDYVCKGSSEDLFTTLVNAINNNDSIEDILNDSQVSHSPGPLEMNRQKVEELVLAGSFEEVLAQMSVAHSEDPWLNQCLETFKGASLYSLYVTYMQMEFGPKVSLEQAFAIEKNLGAFSLSIGEFQEGVRALLVDKDKKPSWKFKNTHELPQNEIKDIFEKGVQQ